ncbi:vacuolar protein sorting-associated protein 53 [Achlya hypogyna]|uniref:Vacuolar protein sorting-associated protein 53 n=1 Tax=Achlya hypogyna TaxID=1202772 RepID=A0A1V9ZAJ3_ACHHY|nr:vacuolar protein sorting-associated protein 53 [Achlya hypogyna]
MELPQGVEAAISRVLPSEDVLDRQEFDCVEFVNRNFPDEQSLADIEPFVSRLNGRMKELDESLSHASQEQSLAAHQALADLKEAQQAVSQLYTKIYDIRGKAEQSEIMVQEICRDIKQLDYAKRHLQTSITALKRLHMLVTAVDQLEYMASQRLYKEAASLMEAVNSLFTHFEGYSKVGKIIELTKSVNAIRLDLETQIFGDFQVIGPLASLDSIAKDELEMNHMFKNLTMACAVVSALGHETRAKLVATFCTEQLLPYEKEFGGKGSPAGGLANIDARFAWFFQLIAAIEGRMEAIFPVHWQISRRLCLFFCERTRVHLLAQLGAVGSDELDVTSLLKALQKALLFEREVVQRYEGDVDDSKPELNDKGQVIDPASAEGIKRRLLRQKRLAEQKAIRAELQKKAQNEEHMGVLHETEDEIPTLSGLLSRTFDPFMTSYVALERKNMEAMLNEVMGSELVDRNGALPVFSSSVNMFAYIRNSVKRCTALTNGQTFFDLHVEFKHCIAVYSQRLVAKLPAFATMDATPAAASQAARWRLAENQEEELCFVINTAEYCAETLPSLEDVIRAKIDPAYADAIELAKETDMCHDVAAAAMKCIVLGLDNLVEEEWANMQRINWAAFENVGDESPYVMAIADKLRPFVPTLHSMLSGLYFTNFCDKFAAAVVPKVLGSILKCKRVSAVATQQLLLDVHALKMLFLNLPAMGREGEVAAPTVSGRYAKFVTNEMAHAEAVLKLIGTPQEMLIESFKIMWPEGTAADFQTILNMKGIKKADQLQLLEQLGLERKAAPKSLVPGVEEMTESLKTNMQKMAKATNPFTYMGTAQGPACVRMVSGYVRSPIQRELNRSVMRHLFRKDRPSPAIPEGPATPAAERNVTPVAADGTKKHALRDLDVGLPEATQTAALKTLLELIQRQDTFPLTRSEASDVIKRCSARVASILRTTIDGVEKTKGRTSLFSSATPQRPFWSLPMTNFTVTTLAMQLLSVVIRDDSNVPPVLDDKLPSRLVACLDIALHDDNPADAVEREVAADHIALLLSVLVAHSAVVADLVDKDRLLPLYKWCAVPAAATRLYKVLLELPRSFVGAPAATIVTHLRSRDVLLVLLDQLVVADTCDASGIIHIVAAHLRYAAKRNLPVLHAQLLARHRYDALLEFLQLWLAARASSDDMDSTFDLIHSLQELLASGHDKPPDHYIAKAKEELTILKPTPRPRLCCMCNPAAMDVVVRLIYRLQRPFDDLVATSYRELVQCQLVHTLGHVLMQDASHYVVALDVGLLEGLVQRLEEFSDVVKLAIGSIFSSVAMEAGVVPYKELRRMQLMLDMQMFSYASVHMLLVLLANLVRFHADYVDILAELRMSETLYNMFIEDAQAAFRFAWPSGECWAGDCSESALDAWLRSHTELRVDEDEADSDADTDDSSAAVVNDHNAPLIFELMAVFVERTPAFWTPALLEAMSAWVFHPVHSHACLHLWATLVRGAIRAQSTSPFALNALNWGLQALRKTLVAPAPSWGVGILLFAYLAALVSPAVGGASWDIAHLADLPVSPLGANDAVAAVTSLALQCDFDVLVVATLQTLARAPPAQPPVLHVLDALFCLLQTWSLQCSAFLDHFHRRTSFAFGGHALIVALQNIPPLEQAAAATEMCWYVAALAVDVSPAALRRGDVPALRLVQPSAAVGLLQLIPAWSAQLSDVSVQRLERFIQQLAGSPGNVVRLVAAGALEALLRAYFPIARDAFEPLAALLVTMARVRLGPRDLRCWVQKILSDECPSLLPRLLGSYPTDADVLATVATVPRFELALDTSGYAQFQLDLPPSVPWPPQEGYTFSSWVYIDDVAESHSDVEKEYHQLTLRDQCIMCRATYPTPVPLKCSHVACRSCVQRLTEFGGACVVCNGPVLYLWSIRSSDGRSVVDLYLKGAKLFMRTNAAKHATPFQHPPLLEKRWYHIALVHGHQRFQFQMGSAASLYIQGGVQETIKMSYPVASPSPFLGMFGVARSTARRSKARWCFGPTYVFEEPLSAATVSAIYAAGPRYDQLFFGADGNGTLPVVLDGGAVSSASTFLDVVANTVSQSLAARPPAPLALPTQSVSLNADRIVLAYSPRNTQASGVLVNACRAGQPLAQGSGGAEALDPVLLPQAAFQLCGAGAKLAYVLLEHAHTVEAVESSLQLLLALTRGQRAHLAGVESESGYEIVNLLLREKRHLLSLPALDTLFAIVQGDVFNATALQHWILDTSIWLATPHHVQRRLCATLYQILVVGSSVEKKQLQAIGIVRQLLYVLLHGSLLAEFAAVIVDLLLVCLDTLANDANYVDVSVFLASLMSANFRFVHATADTASLSKRLDRWGLSPRGLASAGDFVPDRTLARQALLRDLLLNMMIKAVQKQDVKLAKLQPPEVPSASASPHRIARPKVTGVRKVLTPAWIGLFLYPAHLPHLPLVAATATTVLLGLQLLGALLSHRSYEHAYKLKGCYRLLAAALPAQPLAAFPFDALFLALFCLMLGPPADGWPQKSDPAGLSVAHLTHDFEPNILVNAVKNPNVVPVLLATVRRAYAASCNGQPDPLHLEVLRFLRYLYETMPAFADVVDAGLHTELARLIAAVVLQAPGDPFAHPVAAAAMDLLVESLATLCMTSLTGLNVVRAVVAGGNAGALPDAMFVAYQSLVLVQILRRVKDKLSTQEFWLPGSVCVIDNIGGLCLLALARIQCWQHAQPGVPASCGPAFCAAGPASVLDLVFYLLCETPVGISASKSTFQPPSQDKKKRQLRQFLGTIGVNLSRTAFETDPFMEAMFASLNGTVLHVLAVQDGAPVVALLQRLHRQREAVLGSRNGDKSFFRCLCRHLLQWILPGADAALQEAALVLWVDLLYFQKAWVSELLTVTLKVSNSGYSVNLVKNGFDMLLAQPVDEFLKWLSLVGLPLKQLEADLDAGYVSWVERTRKEVSKEWQAFYADRRKLPDDKAFLQSKFKEHAKELQDRCRREVQRQARWQSDQKDRDLFGRRQFAKASAAVAIVRTGTSDHANLFVEDAPEAPAVLARDWHLDYTEGTYRMRKRLIQLPRPSPAKPTRRHRSYSCSDISCLPATVLEAVAVVRPPSPKPSRVQSLTSMLEDEMSDEDDEDEIDWQTWVQLDDSALDAKLRPLLVPGDEVTEDLQDCHRVDGMDKCPSVLLLGTQHVYLVDHLHTDGLMKRKVVATGPSHDCRFWNYDEISELHKRRYLLQHVAIELFAHDGRNYLIAFGSGKQRERVFSLLCAKCPHVKGASSGLDRNATSNELLTKILGNSLLERWVHGEVTNFEYLMHLNTLAGRSYNDLTQYPVFPWVLSDYTAATIDLNDPGVYRDLTKPMGALYREPEFTARYESLEGGDVPPFHYGTHYSSSGIVLHYLMRLEPFTTAIQQLQGGRFDHADRLFKSVPAAYASASGCSPSRHQSNNTQDVKELIPEFFYLPAFLENPNSVDFGTDQTGVRVDAVELPPWAQGSAAEFVRVNRAALESPYVSSMLHHWIDLIFGYKQQGPAAVDACNVFYHLTYEGALDLETVADPAMKAAYLDQINEFGQTPSQLFKAPHPPRDKDKTLFLTRMQRTFLNRSALHAGSATPPIESPGVDHSLPPSALLSLADVPKTVQPELRREVPWVPTLEAFRLCVAHPVHQLALRPIAGLRRDERVVAVPSQCLLLPAPADALLSSDVKFLAWHCRDRSLRLFSTDGAEPRLLATLELPDFCASAACATADARTVVFVDARAPILHVWSFKARTQLTRTSAAMRLRATLAAAQHGRAITAVAASRAFSLLVTGCSAGLVLLWDLNRLSVVATVAALRTPIVAIAVHEVVGDFAVATASSWFVCDVNGAVVASASADAISAIAIGQQDVAAWAPEALLVTGHADGAVRVWGYGRGRACLKATFGPPAPLVTCVELSRDAKRIYSGHGDGRVFLWRLTDGSAQQA